MVWKIAEASIAGMSVITVINTLVWSSNKSGVSRVSTEVVTIVVAVDMSGKDGVGNWGYWKSWEGWNDWGSCFSCFKQFFKFCFCGSNIFGIGKVCRGYLGRGKNSVLTSGGSGVGS